MAFELTPRQHRVVGDTIRRVEGQPTGSPRIPRVSHDSRGVDFGTIIVPRTTIMKATRTVQSGSDDFEPGTGTAFLFRVAADGLVTPWLDQDGNAIFKDVCNLSTTQYESNSASMSLQDGSSLSMQDDGEFELQSDPSPTDYIGPDTPVLWASMDRAGKLIIPPDEQGTAGGSAKFVKNDSGANIPKASGDTPGVSVAPVSVWEFSNGALAETGANLTVYNWMDYVIPEDELFVIEQEAASSRWIPRMDGQHTIVGLDTLSDGQNTLFPYDRLRFIGDRDLSAVLGNIIDITIPAKVGNVVDVNISATGAMFRFSDEQTPQLFEKVDLGETIDLVSSIDKTSAVFSEWRVSEFSGLVDLAFGKLITIVGNTGTEIIYPEEELRLIGAGGASVHVEEILGGAVIKATITAGNDGKVKVNTGDTSDFLEGQYINWSGGSAYSATRDLTVELQTESNSLRAYIDAQNISGYLNNTELHLALDSDVLKWIAPAANDGKTKVEATDTLDYLEDQFVTWADVNTYASAADLTIDVETELPGGDAQLRLFVDSSAISGWSATGELHLALDSDVLKWIAPGASDGRTKVEASDDLDYLENQFVDWADTANFNATFDPVINVETIVSGDSDLKLFIDASAITGYHATEERHLTIESGLLWKAPSAGTTWIVAGDTGSQTISSGDTLSALGGNGIGTAVTATDTLTISIDSSVLQSFTLTGSGTGGTDPILVSAGSDNLIDLISSGSSTTTRETGVDGWVELLGGTGTLEFKLHEGRRMEFTVFADEGVTQTINDGSALFFTGSERRVANSIPSVDWGIVIETIAPDTVYFSVDETVHQKTRITGTAATGTNVIDIDGPTTADDNHLILHSDKASTVQETGTEGWIEIKGNSIDARVEFILHEQTAAAGGSFTLAGDTGSEPIATGNTLSALGGNGIGTIVTATDTLTISIDSSVLQSFTLTGSGTGGTDPILVSAGSDNLIDLISSGSSTTTRETGVDGWVELLGGTGTLEFKLHEGRRMEFNVDGDTGPAQLITDGNKLNILGSALTAAGTAADRGVTTVAVGTDVLTVSVDETVHQKTTMVGDGTDLSTVNISGGTRNTLTLRSGGAGSTVQEAGATGWIQIQDTGVPGEVEFILHEQSAAAGGSFTARGDKGDNQSIAAGDTLFHRGSNLTAAASQTTRGIVTTGTNTDEVVFSVDQSVHQLTALSGETSGQTPVQVVQNSTRNTLTLTTTKANTVTEASETKGWIETVGDATGGVELKLHDRRFYTFSVSADSGLPQTISDTDQLKLLGSNLQAAAAAGDRGIVTEMAATDICQISIDETVHQKTALLGSGTTGITPVLVGAGTTPRNTLTLVSDKTTTTDSVEGSGKGWIELIGDSNGEVEFILHEQPSSYTFFIDAETGTSDEITDTNVVLFEGSGGTAASSGVDRGIATVVSVDAITISVDESVCQEVFLSGTGQTGATTIPIEDGTRNRLEIRSDKSATVIETTESKGYIELEGGTDGGIDIILHELSSLPIGRVVMSVNSTAQTGWAIMDGSANAAGSGIDMRNYFPRGATSTGAGGRTGPALTASDEVEVTDHADHFHNVDADACDDDTGGTFFKFSTLNRRVSGVVDSGGSPSTLIHVLDNNQGTGGTGDDFIEMLPAYQKLWFFERIS